MLEAFFPKSATRVVVYLQPINVQWGAKKLGTFCREVLRVEPNETTCFLFANGSRNTLVVYFLGSEGEQTLMKKLDKGSFLLPAADTDGALFVVLRPSMCPACSARDGHHRAFPSEHLDSQAFLAEWPAV